MKSTSAAMLVCSAAKRPRYGRCSVRLKDGRCSVRLKDGRCSARPRYGRCSVRPRYGRCSVRLKGDVVPSQQNQAHGPLIADSLHVCVAIFTGDRSHDIERAFPAGHAPSLQPGRHFT